MRVIGTAGHVDHGKSTLIEALTGTHPDRLKEEQERQLSIELGFAWFTLPNGEELGVVDVPGHRDFIGNMLAGIGGIDAAMLVIAADEGVMPQTREHLAILDILQVRSGLVALTKIDKASDPEWLDLIELDVRQALEGTALSGVEIVRVSGKTGEGLEELQSALEKVVAGNPSRPNLGRPRLPIDRVFTVSGFGTVVTGTLTDGSLNLGDEVEVLPPGLRGRVRGLQTHKRKVETAIPGSRTAINISGINADDIQRGHMVAAPGVFKPTRRLDVRVRLLDDVSKPLKHNKEIKLFIGAAEMIGRVRLLGVKELLPGEEGWLQIELRDSVVAARGDRYVLRQPSPAETIGGGEVVDPHPRRRHKRFTEGLVERLEALAVGSPAEVLLQTLQSLKTATLLEVVERSNLSKNAASAILKELAEEGKILVLAGDAKAPNEHHLFASRSYWEQFRGKLIDEVESYHLANPLKLGMPREELKSRLKVSGEVFDAGVTWLVDQGALREAEHLVHLPEHEIKFTRDQQKAVDALMARFAEAPHAPPTVMECQEAVGEEVLIALVQLGKLVRVSREVVFRAEDYEAMQAEVCDLIEGEGQVTVASVRDHFETSRRYVLALLEHLDAEGITVRKGDYRRLRGG